MKLKRIISALIVFTLVMTCAVCSVNAAGTYNVTTNYNIATRDITVNAAIASGAEGDMVSYLIVAPYEVTTGEGEEAVKETVYNVKPDGSNILHIDQATLNNSGAATMDAVTAPYAYFKGGKVKFVSTGDELTRKESAGKPFGYIASVEKFTDVLTGITFLDENDNGQPTYFYYVKTDGTVIQSNPSTNLTADRWDDATKGFQMTDWYNGDTSTTTHAKLVPIDDVAAYIVVGGNMKGRGNGVKYTYAKKTGSLSGETNKEQSFTIYDSYKLAEGVAPTTNLMVNGFYKEDVTDGKFGTIDLEGGAIITLNKSNDKVDKNLVKYMSVDSRPIYGEYTNVNGTFDSVTFLVTAPSVEIADKAGLKITAYPKGTVSMNGTVNISTGDMKAGAVELGICPNAYTGKTKFAIQLFDGAKSGQLNPAQWDIEATPVINVGDAENPDWKELTVFGDGVDTYGKYYTVDRTTDGIWTEAVAE